MSFKYDPDAPLTLAAIARSGDTILIGFTDLLTDEEAESFKAHFQQLKDLGIEVGILDGVSSIVVARPEPDEGDA